MKTITKLSLAVFTVTLNANAVVDCPNSSRTEDLSNFRSLVAPLLAEGNDWEVTQTLERCFPVPTVVPACLQRTQDYAYRNDLGDPSLDTSHDNDPHKQPPAEIRAVMDGVTGYEIRPDIEQLARQKGWLTARYKSRHAGGFDRETPSLLMLYVPGSSLNPPVNYDRWLNFPLPKDAPEEEMNPVPQARIPNEADYRAENHFIYPRTFTMVTVERPINGKPSEIYFQMFQRQNSGNKVFTPLSQVSVSSCYSCHMNGLRAISPLGYHVRQGERQMPMAEWKAVKAMNDSMEDAQGEAPPSWRIAGGKEMFKPNAHGPIIGPMQPLNPTGRTEEFLKSCMTTRTTIDVTDIFGRAPGRNNVYTFTQDPPVDLKKVKRAMNCASCHNGVQRGVLNGRADWSQIDFKILVDQSMPMGWHMNPLDQGDDASAPVADRLNLNERIALANCLQAEYGLETEAPQLTKWLTATACQ